MTTAPDGSLWPIFQEHSLINELFSYLIRADKVPILPRPESLLNKTFYFLGTRQRRTRRYRLSEPGLRVRLEYSQQPPPSQQLGFG